MLAAEEDGRLAAMLHLIPFESELGRTTYIYGVATDPDYRGRGLASGLMREAMRRIAEEEEDAAILNPSQESLKDYYAPFGFEDRSLPGVFEAPDDFDFGAGNQEQDRAMVWRRDNSAPLPERLHCRLLGSCKEPFCRKYGRTPRGVRPYFLRSFRTPASARSDPKIPLFRRRSDRLSPKSQPTASVEKTTSPPSAKGRAPTYT